MIVFETANPGIMACCDSYNLNNIAAPVNDFIII